MSYLRTNIRTTGRDLPPDALGGAVNDYLAQSSGGHPIAGGRAGKFYGGLVVWTISEQNSIYSIATDSILAKCYGVTIVSNLMGGGDGYRVFPINIMNMSGCSILRLVYPTVSITGSIVLMPALETTMSTGPSAVLLISTATSISQHLMCVGIIVSTPFGPWGV